MVAALDPGSPQRVAAAERAHAMAAWRSRWDSEGQEGDSSAREIEKGDRHDLDEPQSSLAEP